MNEPRDDARQQILRRVREAVGSPSVPVESDYSAIAWEYSKAANLEDQSRIELFCERLHAYGASVLRSTEPEIPRAIDAAMKARSKTELLIPRIISKQWLPAGFVFLSGEELSYEELDHAQGVLTTCAVAIALTGTIILLHTPIHGTRALTLIPDYHRCIVFEDQVMETVPEGIRMLENPGATPITTISGPSATSDIEMIRVKGVHGPRFSDVIIVQRAAARG